MTLKFLNDIRTEINALFPDNTAGLITPAALRTVVNDMVDSLFDRGCALRGPGVTPVAQALTATPTLFPALYTDVINNNPSVFTTNLVAGNITALEGGFSHQLQVSAIVAAAINTQVSVTVFKNGAAISGQAGVETTGAGETKTLQFTIPVIGVVDNDVFDIRWSSVPNQTVTFTSLGLILKLSPTQSPI